MNPKIYTLKMDCNDEHDELIGCIYEFPNQLLNAQDATSLLDKAKELICKNAHLDAESMNSEPFKIDIVYGKGFIHKKRRDDPEVALYLELLKHQLDAHMAHFHSAEKFAGIAANSLIYLRVYPNRLQFQSCSDTIHLLKYAPIFRRPL